MPHTVFITGVTGHVGFSVLLDTLRAGYNVRAAVRSEAKKSVVLSKLRMRYRDCVNTRLSFIVIPNIATARAFDEAVHGADYIIHVASPIATAGTVEPDQYENHFIRPAVHGTLSILNAAARSITVRRIIITNSIVALVSLAQLEGREESTGPVCPSDRVPFPSAPYKDEFEAYRASKIAALSVAEKWVQTRKPCFDVVHLHPSFVSGRSHLVSTKRDMLKGTNSIILGIALGKAFGSFIGATVHNEDVAYAHVQALNSSVPGNASYILSQSSRWDQVKDIARKHFPSAVASRTLPLTGSASTIEIDVDTNTTEQFLKFQHQIFEAQVIDVLSHYLEILGLAKQCRESIQGHCTAHMQPDDYCTCDIHSQTVQKSVIARILV